MARKITADFTKTTRFVLGACWAAKDGDAAAKRLLENWLKTDAHARKIIMEFYERKHSRSRGMPRGRITKKGEWTRFVLREVVPAFEKKARDAGSRKPVTDGALSAAHRLNTEYALGYAPADLHKLANKLLAARRRGVKKRTN